MILRRAVLYAFFGVFTMFGLARVMAGQTPNSITAPVAPAVPQAEVKAEKPTVYVVIQADGTEAGAAAATAFKTSLESIDAIDIQYGDPQPGDSSGPVVHLLGHASADGKSEEIFAFILLYHDEDNAEVNYIGSMFGYLTPDESEEFGGKVLVNLLGSAVGEYLADVAEEKAGQ